MYQTLHNIFLPKSFFQGSSLERRRSLMVYMLVFLMLCVLPFYFIYQPDYDHTVNLLNAAGFACLLGLLLLGVPYSWVAHMALFWGVGHVVYFAVMTGGINSPAMVWMTVTILPAILILERIPGLLWGIAVFFVNLMMLIACQQGLINSDINTDKHIIAWTVSCQLWVIGFAMYVVFVTERMQRSQTHEMEESNAELEKTHQALLRAQAHKDEFIASVGHELRTPMNAILGLNDILCAELQARPEDVAVVKHIRRSTEQLLQVVNDILDFSQLQARRLTLREDEFGLREMLEAVVFSHTEKAQLKKIKLSLEADTVRHIWAKGDQTRLEQVLNNLLDNAIKFTSEGSVIVRAQVVSEGIWFEVEDTGIGIAHDRQKQIFHGFEHADIQTNRQYGGTGLGLSICERLVTLQGGSIGVSSVYGHGARFWFLLPLRTVSIKEEKAGAEVARLLMDKPIRILLVDDNSVNLLVAQMMLKKCFPKAEVVQASSGLIALETLRTQHYDLVLMDMVMPDMDGMEATQKIRQEFSTPFRDVPILALTASSNPVDHDRCLASGMNAVLHKPLDENQLITKISSVLAQQTAWGNVNG